MPQTARRQDQVSMQASCRKKAEEKAKKCKECRKRTFRLETKYQTKKTSPTNYCIGFLAVRFAPKRKENNCWIGI